MKPPHLHTPMDFEPKKLKKTGVHSARSSLPVLPCAQCAVYQHSRLGLRQPSGIAGCADVRRLWI